MMAEPYGAFALVLHSHIPYVLSYDRLEEEWLLEAAVECYLPLLQALERLSLQGIAPRITLGLTPVLLEQLADPRFASRLLAYVEQKTRAAQEDRRLFQAGKQSAFSRLAGLWAEFYRRMGEYFAGLLGGDLVGAFRRLQRQGAVEIITSAATHAYLPLLGFDESVRAQVAVGAACSRQRLKRRPRGFWLPECAYRPAAFWVPPVEGIDGLRPADRPAIDHFLSAAALRYFIVDDRQLKSSPPDYTRHSPFRVYWVDGRDAASVPRVAVFSRDFETTSRVWQHDAGYPGDPLYLEFHKKQGDSGLRYWRITDRRATLAYKQVYVPEWAFTQVGVHAAHFVRGIRETLRAHWLRTREQGILVAAFDTELFGHWWFEGPQWLYEVLRQLALGGDTLLMSCGEYLDRYAPQHTVQLRESSWGAGGDHRVWLQKDTRQLWHDVYQAECDMQHLGMLARGRPLDAPLARVLRQCGRELLLLQASDWPFMLSTRSTPDHAERRFALHYKNFQHCALLAEGCLKGEPVAEGAWQRFEEIERRDPLFPDLDPRVFWPWQEPSDGKVGLEQRAALVAHSRKNQQRAIESPRSS
ncbi:MAG: 1,4-alpha-glucan branching protein domain-containing protein [Thermodesulfobacteriota bacterium]